MFPESRYRKTEGLGVWEHRGKVAIVGLGNSPTSRRWDGTLETSLGAWTMLAAQKALDEAGITVDDVDGVISCDKGMGMTGVVMLVKAVVISKLPMTVKMVLVE